MWALGFGEYYSDCNDGFGFDCCLTLDYDANCRVCYFYSGDPEHFAIPLWEN